MGDYTGAANKPKKIRGKTRLGFLGDFRIILPRDEEERVLAMTDNEWNRYKDNKIKEELDKW